MIERSETISELAKALAKAQAQLAPAIKDKVNPAFRSKYADLGAVWEACRAPLTNNGLSVVQFPIDAEPGRVALTTMLLHTSGEYLTSTVSTRLVKDDPQGIGSALTYLRRYALSACVGVVADEDDDGNHASGHHPQPQPAAAPVRAIPAQGGNRPIQRAEPGKAGDVSGKQAGYIKALREELGWDLDRLADYASTEAGIHTPLHNLTSWEASQLIKALEAARDGVPYSYSKQEQPA